MIESECSGAYVLAALHFLVAPFVVSPEQRNHLWQGSFAAELELHLLMAFRVLFSPELQEKRRHRGKDSLGAVDFGMASRTERHHQAKNRFAGHAMMHND